MIKSRRMKYVRHIERMRQERRGKERRVARNSE
jgi:hypothetical protein